jgi:two-component system, LytTR family, sensor kinase
MNFRHKVKESRSLQILFLFFIFHTFWLLFYFLSEAVFIKSGLPHVYVKQSLINSFGFAAFCLSAYWLFPFFVSKNKWGQLSAISLIIIIGLGYTVFTLQDWDIKPFSSSASTVQKAVQSPAGKKIMSPVVMKQATGAPVRAMLTILVYLLLGVGYAYMKDWFIKDRRTRILEKEKLQAELTLLRYQLNPHFLFNTINDIYYLALIKSDKTADAILKVSDLLRYVLNEKEDQVPLDKEINHLKEFIRLQQFRFPDQFICVKMDLADDIHHYQIAPLLLLTFVENAFKHGEPGTQEDPVQIRLRVLNEKLVYEVSNKFNGDVAKDATTGIGLNNLRRRLSLLYPNRHQLNLLEENNHFTAHLQIELS